MTGNPRKVRIIGTARLRYLGLRYLGVQAVTGNPMA